MRAELTEATQGCARGRSFKGVRYFTWSRNKSSRQNKGLRSTHGCAKYTAQCRDKQTLLFPPTFRPAFFTRGSARVHTNDDAGVKGNVRGVSADCRHQLDDSSLSVHTKLSVHLSFYTTTYALAQCFSSDGGSPRRRSVFDTIMRTDLHPQPRSLARYQSHSGQRTLGAAADLLRPTAERAELFLMSASQIAVASIGFDDYGSRSVAHH